MTISILLMQAALSVTHSKAIYAQVLLLKDLRRPLFRYWHMSLCKQATISSIITQTRTTTTANTLPKYNALQKCT